MGVGQEEAMNQNRALPLVSAIRQSLFPYCPTALLPYCPTALLPYAQLAFPVAAFSEPVYPDRGLLIGMTERSAAW